jgi:putative endonuclease
MLLLSTDLRNPLLVCHSERSEESNSIFRVLYIGVIKNSVRRVYDHKKGLLEDFIKKYGLKRLVYYEGNNRIEDAISKEKQLKCWLRKKRLN